MTDNDSTYGSGHKHAEFIVHAPSSAARHHRHGFLEEFQGHFEAAVPATMFMDHLTADIENKNHLLDPFRSFNLALGLPHLYKSMMFCYLLICAKHFFFRGQRKESEDFGMVGYAIDQLGPDDTMLPTQKLPTQKLQLPLVCHLVDHSWKTTDTWTMSYKPVLNHNVPNDG